MTLRRDHKRNVQILDNKMCAIKNVDEYIRAGSILHVTYIVVRFHR